MESAQAVTRARVGLDARLTRQLSVGMKSYVTNVTRRLPAAAPEYSYAVFSRGGNFGWSEQVELPLAIRNARVDLMHFLSLYVPVIIPARFVITIHDLIHLRFPQYFKAKVAPYYQTIVRAACARARRIITDDERTVQDLVELLGVDAAKVRVVALGVDEIYLAAGRQSEPDSKAPGRYLLYVGNHRAHKDLGTLFEAWSALSQADALDLYLTGPDDFGGELQRRSTPRNKIVALGEISAPELAQYYAGALALVQPALREGFGLPMLEAMASACAVVASEDAVPRVLRPAAMTFPAGDVRALRGIIETLAGDEGLRGRFVNVGTEIARQLTWDRCARATADVYREVLEEAC